MTICIKCKTAKQQLILELYQYHFLPIMLKPRIQPIIETADTNYEADYEADYTPIICEIRLMK